MSLTKRKIAGFWHFMPDGEYSLCGEAFDGEDGRDVFGEDRPIQSAREITCGACRGRINAVRQLIKAGPAEPGNAKEN